MAPEALPRTILPDDAVHILRELNPWWETQRLRRPPPPYRRRGVDDMCKRIGRSKGLIEVIRGPRQVGKTTAIEQVIDFLLSRGVRSLDILFVRFDQEVLRDRAVHLGQLIRWYAEAIRGRPLEEGAPGYVFLDEVHKLEKWDSEVKHLFDTFPVRLVLTGSSSVLVARGGRESLAGRTFSTEFPTFSFREVLEAWTPQGRRLPPARGMNDLFALEDPRDFFEPFRALRGQRKPSLKVHLERYYNRGGYPRLYNGEIEEDLWTEYLTETVFSRVLGVDVPDLFPVRNPQLLRWLYVEVARATGQEIKQTRLVEDANAAGFSTNQPNVGNYLHYLADALLIREFRRYPLVRRENSRTPAKVTLTDLGPRNAVFRGAPSLWESSPNDVGPLVETLVQTVIRGPNLAVHFYRDYDRPGDRRTPIREVDFVAEDASGRLLPIEVKFRRSLDTSFFQGLKHFRGRFAAKAPFGLLVTREDYEWREEERLLALPLLEFLLAF
jgi:hypothetical protein